MFSIYMNNFRGFSDTLVSLSNTTFLVGENSTGKSSFLKLLRYMSSSKFWAFPSFDMDDVSDLGTFSDIVSASSKDKRKFDVGILYSNERKSGQFELEFTVLSFRNEKGACVVSRMIQYRTKRVVTLFMEDRKTKFFGQDYDDKINNLEEAFTLFRKVINENFSLDTKAFEKLPDTFPASFPLPIIMSFLDNRMRSERLKSRNENLTEMKLQFSETRYPHNIVWIAPIRSKPLRYYDGRKRSFSPEGIHAPYVLQQSLKLKSKSKTFIEKISEFGASSGLFKKIEAHRFGKEVNSPFEILIHIADLPLNMNNVGYGISQVLRKHPAWAAGL